MFMDFLMIVFYGLMYNLKNGINSQKKDQQSTLMRNCYLSFFASLFADRHGTIYNVTNDSLPASLLLGLYSGFNHISMDSTTFNQYQPILTLNSLTHQCVSKTDSIQTIVLCIFQFL